MTYATPCPVLSCPLSALCLCLTTKLFLAPNNRPQSKMIGVGSAAPPGVIKNTDLESVVETSDEWIFTRTGISQRRILDTGGQIKGE